MVFCRGLWKWFTLAQLVSSPCAVFSLHFNNNRQVYNRMAAPHFKWQYSVFYAYRFAFVQKWSLISTLLSVFSFCLLLETMSLPTNVCQQSILYIDNNEHFPLIYAGIVLMSQLTGAIHSSWLLSGSKDREIYSNCVLGNKNEKSIHCHTNWISQNWRVDQKIMTQKQNVLYYIDLVRRFAKENLLLLFHCFTTIWMMDMFYCHCNCNLTHIDSHFNSFQFQ